MKFFSTLILLSLINLSSALAVVSAVDVNDEKAVTISEIVTREIPDDFAQNMFAKKDTGVLSSDCNDPGVIGTFAKEDPRNPLNPLDQLDMAVDKIINIGTKIWKIIEMGRPVVNVKSDVATALPAGARCWLDLQGWSAPTSKTYEVTFKNGYKSEVIKFAYRVLAVTGGGVDGTGKYIGYATFSPIQTSVSWGFKFNAEGSAPAVFNMGSRAAPVAGMQLIMSYNVDTVIKHIQQSQAYFLDGNGNLKEM